MKELYLLGATGSIGTQVLDIVKQNPDEFKVVTMTANHRIEALKHLINEFKPEFVSVGQESDAIALQKEYPHLEVGYGPSGLMKASTYHSDHLDTLLVNALVGISGLLPTVEAIKIKRDIALANKETLVVAGDIINQLLQEYQVNLYPIDSEHSAIWQCLNGEDSKSIHKLIITASGGTFRDYLRSHLQTVTVEEALKHPNWSMGNKITIDSATMMNKGFEVIEAYHLFHVLPHQIETIIHRESIVHSMVEFNDHSIIAQLSDHDMRLPISYALFYPKRVSNPVRSLNLVKLGKLSFEEVSFDRYPCLSYAYQALNKGGNACAILNAANEAAVDLFLKYQIDFLSIETIIKEALDTTPWIEKPTLMQLINTDEAVKKLIYQRYKKG